jgi:LAO/AO transport system kinase
MASVNTFRELSRAISIVANGASGYEEILSSLSVRPTPVIGITGPPGAGKSTLTDKIIGEMVRQGKYVAVLCVDPSSPFSKGAILGDRIRMSEWYNDPQVFIRSLATRGSLGGLPPMSKEIVQLVKAAPFDYIIIETVGVGQNEIEIASLADLTIVVLVPESGDDIQIMKAGLMEIANVFVVNKCDRPGADAFVGELRTTVPKDKKVIKTIANTKYGVGDLVSAINNYFT